MLSEELAGLADHFRQWSKRPIGVWFNPTARQTYVRLLNSAAAQAQHLENQVVPATARQLVVPSDTVVDFDQVRTLRRQMTVATHPPGGVA
jgi:hypothetical protein